MGLKLEQTFNSEHTDLVLMYVSVAYHAGGKVLARVRNDESGRVSGGLPACGKTGRICDPHL